MSVDDLFKKESSLFGERVKKSQGEGRERVTACTIYCISTNASGFFSKNFVLYCLNFLPSLLNAKNNSGLPPLRIIPFAFSSAAVGRL